MAIVYKLFMNEFKVIAALYRCKSCRIWWSRREVDIPEAHLVFRMVEQHKDLFPWEDYQGWRVGADAAVCPQCTKETSGPMFSLTQSRQL
jgi:hypothetical protein